MTRDEALQVYEAAVESSPGMESGVLAGRLFIESIIDLSYDDTITAMVTLHKQQVFLSAAEVRSEVKRLRATRIGHAPEPDLPASLTQEEDIKARRAYWKRVGDGEEPAKIALELGCTPPEALKRRPELAAYVTGAGRGHVPGVLTKPIDA